MSTTRKDDQSINYTVQSKTNTAVKKLEQFLDDESLKIETKSPYSNISDQGRGRIYRIPFRPPKSNANRNTDSFLNGDRYQERITETPIDKFFELLEAARLTGAHLNYAEKQYFTVEGTQKTRDYSYVEKNSDFQSSNPGEAYDEFDYDDYLSENVSDNEQEESVGYLGDDQTEESAGETDSEEDSLDVDDGNDDRFDREIEHSGIMLDFDMFQRMPERQIRGTHYYQFIYDFTSLLGEVLDWQELAEKNHGIVDLWAVFLMKPAVAPVTHPEYGDCYKDGFHVLLPGVKLTKNVKKYLVHRLHERGSLPETFYACEFLNPWTNILDPNSRSVPVLFLGNSKRGKPPYELEQLFHISLRLSNKMPIVRKCDEFNPLPSGPARRVPDPRDRRRKIEVKPLPRYKYNLCYELSIHYEPPNGGLITKRNFDAHESIRSEIESFCDRRSDGLIGEVELRETVGRVTDLTIRNSEAAYLKQILDIISPERVREYDMWKAVIVVLARTSSEYRPLAAWFSQRFPQSYCKNAIGMIDNLFEWVEKTAPDENDESMQKVRSIRTLYDWAKRDNPKKYYEIQNHNAFMVLYNLTMANDGNLNDANLATVIWTMFRNKFVFAINPRATSKQNQGEWYEFVLPTDKLGRNKASVYKWRQEKYPYTLDDYVGKKLPIFISQVREWVQEKRDDEDATEEQQQYYDAVYRKLKQCSQTLGNAGKSSGIIRKCENEFLDRGFIEELDTNREVIGVGNGVLRVFPRTELIQQYHSIAISRYTDVEYMPYDPNNPYIEETENAIKDLFNNENGPETDAYEFTMMYLASTLDGRSKIPLLFIWLGEGGNGKSFLLELHINTLRLVPSGGYGTKLPVEFLIGQRPSADKSNPAMMVLKIARFAYFSESEHGDVLRMGNIKEVTSETLSARNHHESQDNFRANCHFVFCSNHDPRVQGSDHGTWRRIKVYRFKMKFVPEPDPNCWQERKQDSKWIDIAPYNIHYRRAYLSILVNWYEKYRDKYNSNLHSIPKPTIDEETSAFRKEQDTLHRFIEEKVIHVGPTWNGGATEKLPLETVAKSYAKWYAAKVEDIKIPNISTRKALKASKLKRWIEEKYKKFNLTEHIVLQPNEWWNAKKRCIGTDEDREEAKRAEDVDWEEGNDDDDSSLDDDLDDEFDEETDDDDNIETPNSMPKKDNIVDEESSLEDDLDDW